MRLWLFWRRWWPKQDTRAMANPRLPVVNLWVQPVGAIVESLFPREGDWAMPFNGKKRCGRIINFTGIPSDYEIGRALLVLHSHVDRYVPAEFQGKVRYQTIMSRQGTKMQWVYDPESRPHRSWVEQAEALHLGESA